MRTQFIKDDFLINTQNKYNIYLLGLLWADGHVDIKRKSIVYICSQKDFIQNKHIFIKFGIKNFYTRYNKCNGKTCGPYMSWTVFDNNVLNFLIENDYHIKSTGISPEKILSIIPEELHHYWFRGYFDGDGCPFFATNKYGRKFYASLSFCSSSNQNWNFLKKIMDKLGISSMNIRINTRKNGKNSTATFSTYRKICKFFHFLYPEYKYDNIGFKRKFQTLLNIKSYNIRTKNKYQYITWHSQNKTWRIHCIVNNRKICIGYNKDEEVAYTIQQKYIQEHCPA